MVKGKDTFEEVQACIEAVGGECAAGWSHNALTVALLTEYLTKSVTTKVADIRDAIRGAH